MTTTIPTITPEAALFSERNRLIRLCAHLTGDSVLAEDLAQETLLIAWQHNDQLREPTRWVQWVNGIARNLCHYWLRKQCSVERLSHRHRIHDPAVAEEIDNVPAAFDLEIELEQQELGLLLDRALAQLPPLTRTVLVERYIHEAPQAEVAHRLGISEGAVEARIQRGKLTLRRLLTIDLQDEAAAFGLDLIPVDVWQKTRLWCPSCGEHYVQGRFQQNKNGALMLRCVCGFNGCTRNVAGLFDGIHGYRAAMNRAANWRHTYLQTGLQAGMLVCLSCGQSVPLQRASVTPPVAALGLALPDVHGLWAQCNHCSWLQHVDVEALAATFPAVQAFWRQHKRIRTLPLHQVDYAGTPALVASFQTRTGPGQLDLIFQQQSLATLALYTQ